MSDLSGLNPTLHAIAVYASRPLSPEVTQHSLQAGAAPYLGRSSTGWIAPACLAHSLNHLVGAGRAMWACRFRAPSPREPPHAAMAAPSCVCHHDALHAAASSNYARYVHSLFTRPQGGA